MGFRVGVRVVRRGEYGFIHNLEKRRVWMAEVRWESTGVKEWLPLEELRPCDVAAPPPPVKPTPWQRTTPDYIVKLRKELRAKPQKPSKILEQLAQRELADRLLSLSGKHGARSKGKADKLIRRYGKDAIKARQQLAERMARDSRHDK